MSNQSPSDLPLSIKPKRKPGRFIAGCLVVALVMLAAAVAIPWMLANHRLSAAVKRVRARGEPLTTLELNDYYQPAKGRPDLTRQLLNALAICETAGRDPSAKALPFVGEGMDPPPRGKTWEQLDETETFLVPQQEAIKTFHEFARREGTVRFPVDFRIRAATTLPHTQSLRCAARALSLQFHLHLHQDQVSAAMDCILAQLSLARALDQEPTFVSQLVRLVMVGMGLDNAQKLVRQADVSDADLQRLQASLRKIDFQGGLKAGLAGERTFGYTGLAESPWRVSDAAKLLEMNLAIAEGADESLFAARQAALASESELQQLSPATKPLYIFSLLSSPAYTSSINAFVRPAAARDCADAAIAGELFRRQHGQWPAQLDNLVPEFLPAVATDPFANKPLLMQASPESFKVYCAGSDGFEFPAGGR
jgi:hypothetical protein